MSTQLLDDLLADLSTEGDRLWAAVAGLDEAGWQTATPAAGWTVATQIAHLLWTDEAAVAAATDRDAWDELVRRALADPTGYVDQQAREVARLRPEALLARWGAAREALSRALRDYPEGQRMPWFGPPMSPASMATARFMETWAHGLDVYTALGLDPEPTDRVRHVAHLGVRTRDYAFSAHDLPPPAEEFRVDLVAPSGELWTWGPEEAEQSVIGSAWDFGLLVTQRVHRDDTDLVATGVDAARWLTVAQAFAGPPGEGASPEMRVGNCSGFYGDRLSAMREMLEGGPLDYLTGDYLAELTMLILGRDTLKDPSLGYARTFVRQLEDCLGLALERGVRIVSNAGGLNPAGLADRVREVARGLGLDPLVAHVEGDDVRGLGFADALTANAYLGGFGIAAALSAGADVVVTGRVTDASLVVGPAVAHHGWTPTSYDELAGAVVAGHVLECGCQATGGNFSGFAELPHRDRPLGFPLAEIAADGSSVITKHPGTGGAVTLDTVTAQLLYEVQSTRYLNPDVTTRLDTVELTQVGPDRVAVSGVRGEAPPERLKVCVNELGGYRNTVELVLTGLDIDAKAEWVREQLAPALTAAEVAWTRTALPAADADTEEGASCLLRCTVKDPKPEPVGRAFTGAAVELALASYPGFTMTGPPAAPTPYGIYRAEYVDRSALTHTVVHADGRREVIADPVEFAEAEHHLGLRPSPYPAPPDSLTRRAPLGSFVHARSGDKGGDANLGLWVVHDGSDRRDARVTWLTKLITARKVRELVPEAADLEIEVHVLPNLGGVNVVIHGLLGDGVAASTRFDPQAKGLGEWVRSRSVHVQEGLL